MSAVNSIQASPLTQPRVLSGANGPGASGESSFKSFLLDSIGQVNSMQQDANRAVEQLATGGEVSPAEVFTAVQKADLAFHMMMQVRNKLVQAYQDVQNIRV
ncbi:MAG TPA: flagellar hook-basal body complex protein FliE [Pirellulales bacterium]|nr:flagellar hook-basal body complex protein FliE [Pirellulales bacterium]